MTATEFLKLVRQFVDAWNQHDLEALGKLYSEGALRKTFGQQPESKEEVRKFRETVLRAFPDLSVDYRHQFSIGTHGVVEWTIRGTHRGVFETPFGRIPPTGKLVEWQGVSIWEIDEQGLILQERAYPDMLGLMQQLGVLKTAVPV